MMRKFGMHSHSTGTGYSLETRYGWGVKDSMNEPELIP